MSYVKFSYQPVTEGVYMPYVRVRLRFDAAAVDAWVLADTGAEINVIPHSAGVRLGLNWSDFSAGPVLSGNAFGETRVVDIDLSIGSITRVPLTFCWANHDRVKLLLGHQNFFEHFNAFFDTKNREFSILKHAEPS